MTNLSRDKVTVLGVAIDNVTLREATDHILDAAADKSQVTSVAFVNADCLNMAVSSSEYAGLLASRDYVFGDGAGVRYACRLTSQPIVDNVNGTDLFPRLCEAAAHRGQSIYLLGGKPGVAERAGRRVTARYPQVKIAGCQHGYFDPACTDTVIDAINASGADILLVAMGAPSQEFWIKAHADRLRVGVAMGVGGLLDFVAGEVGRANPWVRKLGFEWLVRFANEPTRLLKRYFAGNPLFLFRVLQSIKRTTAPSAAPACENHAERFDHWRDFELLDRAQANLLAQAGPVAYIRRAAARKVRAWQFKRRTRSYRSVKRAIDVVGASFGLVALAPLFALTAAAIYLTDPGPVFYAQTRIGYRGRRFNMLKFRSMVVNADAVKDSLLAQNESAGGVLFKMKRDPRITRVGAIIRRFSIDELPQLWTVLTGDMTLVGPRPPVPREVAEYSLADRDRLEALPGITCIWQVSGRSDIDFAGQVKLDRDYINNQGIAQDIAILLRTIPAVISGRGAY